MAGRHWQPVEGPRLIHPGSKSRAAASELVVRLWASEASEEPFRAGQACEKPYGEAESADAPAWPRFLPRRAHFTGGM